MQKNRTEPYFHYESKAKTLLRMKLLTFFILIPLMTITAKKGYSQFSHEVSSLDSISVNQLFKAIEQNSNYIIIYNEKSLDVNRKLQTPSFNEVGIESALDELTTATGLNYLISGRQIVVTGPQPIQTVALRGLFGFPEESELQQNVISGKVTDKQGQPIIGATIMVKGTTFGTLTDINGNYTLINVPNSGVIVYTFIGMDPQEILFNNQSRIDIVMKEATLALEEVVVVGYGSQKKETVVGSISQVTGVDLLKTPTTNVSNALVGRIAGISGVQKSGEPGFEETTIRIRGVGTYAGDQSPLVVIDGVVRNMEALNLLDANDIEGINVLKDASATAVYGVRGANGVILVNTKRGQAGKMIVSLKVEYGLTKPTTVTSLVNSYDYAMLLNEAYKNDGLPNDPRTFTENELWKFANNRDYTTDEVNAMTNLSQVQKEALLNSPAIYYSSTDYMKSIFGDLLVPRQQYNFNLTGGSDKVSYFTSIGYANQRSLTNDFGFKEAPTKAGSIKNNFRSNLDFRMIKNTEIKISISGTFIDTDIDTDRNGDVSIGGRYNDNMLNIYGEPPYAGVGIYGNKLISGFAGGSIMETIKMDPQLGRTPFVPLLTHDQAQMSQSNIYSSINVRHKMDYLLKGLTMRGVISYDHFFRKTMNVSIDIPTYTVTRDPENPAELLFFGGEKGTTSISETGWGKNRKFYVEYGLDFNRKFGKHEVSATGVITGERYTAPGLTYNVPRGFYGVVGRTTYNYANRYFGEFNMGYNGSENFAPGKQFGFFPSVSAGWVITNEPYFPKNNIITWLKLRGSYGQTGNSEIGGNRFLYLPGTWGSHSVSSNPLQGYYFGTTNGSATNPAFNGKYEQTVGNPNVTWEKKESYNIALEIRSLKDRLSITADFFKEKRNNILTRLGTTPGIIGVSGSALPPVNVGKMSNKGFEIQTSWRDRIGENLYYEMTGQISYAVNKIDYMAEPEYEYIWMNTTGFSNGQFKGRYNEGFYNTAEEVANHPYNPIDANRIQGGDLKIVDVNGDGMINQKDIIPVGFSNVPRYTFSGNPRIEFKGFELGLLFTGTLQGTFQLRRYLINPFTEGYGTPITYMKSRWNQERYLAQEEILFPRLGTNLANTPNDENSSFWFRSTDHVKLKNIEISYALRNKKIMNLVNLSSIRFFFNANNIHTWGGKELIDGIDPELQYDTYNSQGIIFPLTRTYNLGIDVQF